MATPPSPELLRSFFDAVSRGDLQALEPLVADKVVFEFPGDRFGGRFEGKRRFLFFMKQNRRLFQEPLRFQVNWAGVADDRGVAQWTNRGVTRDGRDYRNRGVTVFRFVEGEIAEIQDYLDTEIMERTWPAKHER